MSTINRVLRNKHDFRGINENTNVLERDLSREEREKVREITQERKADWKNERKRDPRERKKSMVKVV